MLPEIELSEKNVEHPSNRKKCVESARNISILVAAKTNGREKCSSTKTQKGVQHETALYALKKRLFFNLHQICTKTANLAKRKPRKPLWYRGFLIIAVRL